MKSGRCGSSVEKAENLIKRGGTSGREQGKDNGKHKHVSGGLAGRFKTYYPVD